MTNIAYNANMANRFILVRGPPDYTMNICSVPDCKSLLESLLGKYEIASWYQAYLEREASAVHNLPPYVIERYVRILRLWLLPRSMHTLFELSLRRVNSLSIPLPWCLPKRNVVIHRVFRRMFTALEEAIRYEATANPNCLPFGQYNPSVRDAPLYNSSVNRVHLHNCPPAPNDLLQRWMNRSEHLQRNKCPLHRLLEHLDAIRLCRFVYYKERDPILITEGMDYAVKPHQCGYIRCTCRGYKDIRPNPLNWNQRQVGRLMQVNASTTLKEEKKVPKAKLQADRANSMKARAAQRAGHKRR